MPAAGRCLILPLIAERTDGSGDGEGGVASLSGRDRGGLLGDDGCAAEGQGDDIRGGSIAAAIRDQAVVLIPVMLGLGGDTVVRGLSSGGGGLDEAAAAGRLIIPQVAQIRASGRYGEAGLLTQLHRLVCRLLRDDRAAAHGQLCRVGDGGTGGVGHLAAVAVAVAGGGGRYGQGVRLVAGGGGVVPGAGGGLILPLVTVRSGGGDREDGSAALGHSLRAGLGNDHRLGAQEDRQAAVGLVFIVVAAAGEVILRADGDALQRAARRRAEDPGRPVAEHIPLQIIDAVLIQVKQGIITAFFAVDQLRRAFSSIQTADQSLCLGRVEQTFDLDIGLVRIGCPEVPPGQIQSIGPGVFNDGEPAVAGFLHVAVLVRDLAAVVVAVAGGGSGDGQGVGLVAGGGGLIPGGAVIGAVVPLVLEALAQGLDGENGRLARKAVAVAHSSAIRQAQGVAHLKDDAGIGPVQALLHSGLEPGLRADVHRHRADRLVLIAESEHEIAGALIKTHVAPRIPVSVQIKVCSKEAY